MMLSFGLAFVLVVFSPLVVIQIFALLLFATTDIKIVVLFT